MHTNHDTLKHDNLRKAWRPTEIEALLDAMDSNLALRVYFPGQAEPIYTHLLGFELASAELLLDTFQNFSFYELIVMAEHRQSLTLALHNGRNTWFIDCRLAEIDSSGTHYAVAVKMVHIRASTGQRLHPRVHFLPNSRPTVQLSAARTPRIRAELLDLSAFGCQLRVLGGDIRSQLRSRKADIELKFNEEFHMHCHCEIRQLQFLRRPCCHNKLRLLFRDMSTTQIEQLQTFVHSLRQSVAA